MSKEVGSMVQSKRVQGAGSARTEGARRATGAAYPAAAVREGPGHRGRGGAGAAPPDRSTRMAQRR